MIRCVEFEGMVTRVNTASFKTPPRCSSDENHTESQLRQTVLPSGFEIVTLYIMAVSTGFVCQIHA